MVKKSKHRELENRIQELEGINAQLKGALKDLRESEEKYKLISETFQTGIYIHQGDSIVYANEKFAQLHGYTVEELIGAKFHNLIHPDNRDQVLKIKEKRMMGDTDIPNYYEAMRIRKNGEKFWCQTFAVRIEYKGDYAILGNVLDITNCKAAEEALRQSREDLNRAQAVANIGSWRLNVQRNELTWSDESYRICGVPKGTPLTYENFLAVVHPDDREDVNRKWKAALQGAPYDIEHRFVVGDKVKWVREKAEMEFDEKGALLGGFGTCQDITERKRAEERERQDHQQTVFANRLLRVFVEHEGDELFDRALAIVLESMASKHGVFGFIAQPGHLICPSLSKMLDACEVGGKCIHYPPEKWKGLWAQALTEKRSLYTNDPPPVPHGHLLIHNNLATPILFRNDAIGLLNLANKEGGYTDADRDMLDRIAARIAPVLYAWIQKKLREDERFQAEERLRQSERRLRLALEAAYVISFEWDIQADKVYRFVSADPVLNTTSNEAPSTFEAVREAVHPDDRELFTANVYAAMKTSDGRYENEFRIIHPDGEIHWLYERGYMDRDLEGRATKLIGLSQDVTERKKLENELRQSRDELEGRVKERTAELRKRAEQLYRMSSELSLAEQRERRRIAEILHDHLQQLMVGAKISQEILVSKVDDALRQAAAGVLDLINQSIKVSRELSTELSPPVLRSGDLRAAVEWLARWLCENQSFEVSVQSQDAMILDRKDLTVLLFQSVRELLLNAAKHAGTKSASVKMEKKDGKLQIDVIDKGVGFDSETVGAFAESATGLGLFTIRERLQHLGGHIEIESGPNAGSTISLILPLEVIQSTEKDVPESSAEIAAEADSGGDKLRIAIVDDHNAIRQGMIKLIGMKADIEIVGEATDGESAVHLARETIPDVILMDVSLPGMDGVEATRIIHKDFPHIRIIGLSMYAADDQADAMISAGALAFCSKSDNIDLVMAAIRGKAN